MRGGNVLKQRGSIFNTLLAATGAAGAVALAGCGSGESGQTATVTEPAPTTSTAPANTFKPIVGTVAHTENPQGYKEGTWTYRGPFDTATDREMARQNPIAEGATVQVLCHEDGRTIDLRAQSPNIGTDYTDDWLQLQTPQGSGPEWIPDVYVDTAQTPPEC